MIECLLVVLSLALPDPTARPEERARKYFDEGIRLMRIEQYAEALKRFELSASIARFARFERELQGDTLRMGSTCALSARNGKKAVELAKSYARWAEEDGTEVDRARAVLDCVEAFILHGNRPAADELMERAKRAVESARDHEQLTRLQRLVAGESPPAKSGSGPAVIRRDIETLEPEPDAAPTNVATDREDRSVAPGPDGDMVLIPAGTFRMGQASGEVDERPVREIATQGFRLDRHEVTNQAFETFVAATGHPCQGEWRKHAGAGNEKLPVRGVTWNDAAAYARWAGKRLPTEIEWERAARGPAGWTYSFADGYALTAARTGLPEASGPAPVGSFPASPWGLFDMTGNVLEWCSDWYGADAYQHDARRSGGGPDQGSMRVVRGGAWVADRDAARAANRFAAPPEQSSPRIGFRCARDAP